MKHTIFLEIGTLLEPNYSGIPTVTYQMAKWLFENSRPQTAFFVDEWTIDPSIVEQILERRSGEGLRRLLDRREIVDGRVDHRRFGMLGARQAIAVYPHIKPRIGYFDFEAQFLHDATFYLHPELHTPANIAAHMKNVNAQLLSNDVVLCNSLHTRNDFVTYFGLDVGRTEVCLLGVDPMKSTEHVRPAALADEKRDFIICLGTIEPRKNYPVLFKALAQSPGIFERCCVVFAGKQGWGPTLAEMAEQNGLKEELGRSIHSLGFISEAEKAFMLSNAACLVYPSVYEGFGLPVIEAMAAGCPVITAHSSSLVEAGGTLADYVDPYSPEELHEALEARLQPGRAQARETEKKALIQWASEFTWERFNRTWHQAVIGRASATAIAS